MMEIVSEVEKLENKKRELRMQIGKVEERSEKLVKDWKDKCELVENKVSALKHKCKAKLNCSKELQAKLRCSEDLHKFIALTLEMNLKKKAEEKKKGSWFSR